MGLRLGSTQVQQREQETVQKGPAGSLTLADTAKQQGVVPPTAPSLAQTMTGNPDVAKMAGTPNQVRTAVKAADTLASNLRQTPHQKADSKDKDAAALGQRLTGFARVDEVMAAKAAAAATQQYEQLAATLTPASGVKVNDQALISALGPEAASDPAKLKAAKDNLLVLSGATQGDKQQALAALSATLPKLAGHTADSLTLSSAAQIADLFVGIEPSTLVKQMDKTKATLSLPMSLLDDNDWRSMGFANAPDAAAALGVNPESLATMSFTDTKERIKQVRDQQFATTEQLLGMTRDANVPQNVRAEALARLRKAGLAALRPAEAKVNDLKAQMEDGDTVELPGGVSATVEEMTTEPVMLAMVTELATNPAAREQAKLNPDTRALAEWAEKNGNALQKLTSELQLDVNAINTTFRQNMEKVGDADKALVDVLLPNFGKNPAQARALDGVPQLFDVRKQLRAEAPDLANRLDTLMLEVARKSPDKAKELAARTKEEWLASNDLSGQLGDAAPIKQLALEATNQRVNAINLAEPTGEALALGEMFGSAAAAKRVESQLQDELGKAAFNRMPGWAQWVLDSNKDGKLDDVATMRGKFTGAQMDANAQAGFKEALNVWDAVRLEEKGAQDKAVKDRTDQLSSDQSFLTSISGNSFQPVEPKYLRHFEARVQQEPELKGQWEAYKKQAEQQLHEQIRQGTADLNVINQYTDAGILKPEAAKSAHNYAAWKGFTSGSSAQPGLNPNPFADLVGQLGNGFPPKLAEWANEFQTQNPFNFDAGIWERRLAEAKRMTPVGKALSATKAASDAINNSLSAFAQFGK